MTNLQAKSELMQIYMSLSEEKKQALDVLMAQADGDLISRQAVIDACLNGWNKDYKEIVADIRQLPSLAIPPEHDGCKDCRWQSQSETEMPCKQCMHNYTDEWEMKRPDKIDIVKLCASEEYKQLDQYNISGNKYHLGFANACAWIMNKYREG